MNWSAVIVELPKAIPVILGGLLAVLGGVAGQYFTHRFTRTREHQKLIREKAEELIRALYEHRDWFDAKQNAVLFRQADHDTPSPLDRAYAIQRLYFPELLGPLTEVTRTFLPVLQFLYDQRKQQLNDMKAWLEKNDMDGMLPLYQAYLQAWNTALEATVTAARARIGG